ncbi:transposase InsO family protein [Variovorax sp. GrIS 2.14]
MLAHRGVTQSMSRRGNCFDCAVIESFFGTLKAEYFHLENLGDVDELEAGVKLSPVQYRLRNTA